MGPGSRDAWRLAWPGRQGVDSDRKFAAMSGAVACIAEGNLFALFLPAKSSLPLRHPNAGEGSRWKEEQKKRRASPAPRRAERAWKGGGGGENCNTTIQGLPAFWGRQPGLVAKIA